MTAVGRVLVDRYELLEQRGRGGLGRVWAARDLTESRDVAVKLLHGPPDEEAAALFVREARAAAAPAHPGLVAVLDVGQDTDGTPFLVTELLAGRDLRATLRAGLPEPATVAAWATQVCAALGHAHRAGLVHGDLKPADLFVGEDGRVRVLDLGLAGHLAAVAATGTRLLGTLAYTAPERLRGHPAEPRSDLYALGCVLYELLTGTPPFGTADVAATVYAQLDAIPEPPERRRADVPGQLSRLVLDLLAKDPARRPADAAAVAARLAETPPAAPADRPRPPVAPPLMPAPPVPPPAAPPQPPLGPPPAAPFPAPVAAPFPTPLAASGEDEEPRLRRAAAAGDPDAAVQLAYHLADTGRETEAEALYREALARDHPEAANDLADLLAAHDRAGEAEELYRRALAQGHPDAANNLGRLLVRLGRAPEAEMLFRHASAHGHDDAANNLGLLLAGSGRPDEAEQLFRHVYAQGHPDAAVNLAGLLGARGRLKEAEKLYRRACTEGHPDAALGLAVLLERRGRTREAEEMYRRALAEGHPAAAGRLARFLDAHGRGQEAMWLRS
ncbi:tetratricopeptide repeat protein [Embleya sp. NPDC008237]|uniref:tetratricopeptide repeat protein n=1 Tax=Embleya sp. NPDC008237 TaxID=3363978 RepID=UPI0036EBED3A